MAQIVLEDKDWSEIKQFKDPVYGYIPVCRAYVKSLIDTQLMQRIKGVAQTGFRPVFSSATHDRFSHSLGVYKFGMEMYKSLVAKLPAYVKDTCCPKWGIDGATADSLLERLMRNLKHWETLLAIGCLLHDIGHPVQSHGFEFLYDDPYLDIEYGKQNMTPVGDGMDKAEWERVYDLFVSIPRTLEQTPEGNLSAGLLKAFAEQGDPQSGGFSGTLPGKPHERMSAYYIFKDDELRSAVEGLIRTSRKNSGLDEGEAGQELCFIARMIIGWEYPVARQLAFDEPTFFDSIKNCVIHILNGTIDADGIDYLMRNSYTAGYDTSRIDSARLCNAYTAYAKNYVMFPAFSKSALSVLEGYMAARNFEPKWLYSHHKVVYADLLTKQLYKYITRYLTDRTMLLPAVRQFLDLAPDSAIVHDGPQSFGKKLLLQPEEQPIHLGAEKLHSHMEQWSYPFYTYLLAACRRYSIGPHYFYQSADADMDALFHWVMNELSQYEGEGVAQKYANYREHLRTQLLDELLGRSSEGISLRNLRILLAENCLHQLGGADDGVCRILRAWIESGDGPSALQEAEKLGGAPSALTELLGLTADEGENQERVLLAYWLEQYQPLLAESGFENFIQLLEEYQTRCYRSSLWKSEAEYHLFLKDCAQELGIAPDDAHRYMETLITEGMEEHGFSIFDGKVAKQVPGLYQEQFYYLPPVTEVNSGIKAVSLSRQSVASSGSAIARKWAADIFAATEQYDFSRNNLVVKFYRSKPKRFNKVDLLFNERVVPLEEVFPYHKGGGMFPYLYYNAAPNGESEHILGSFRKKFIGFCREYRGSEVKSEVTGVGMSHVFRDAVYGDIKMPENFYAVVCTKEFQRLGRIRQLATADRRFPNATHTRLAHSLGTWHVMRLILDHFEALYHDNQQLRFTENDRSCALLAALLHDLGHGPYSHMVETVFHLSHEEMTRRIILDPSTEVHRVVKQHFGKEMPQRVCRLLDSAPLTGSSNGIDLIYRSVISGQLDADRIDYLMRDNVACGMAFGHIDIQQLIASMRLMPDYRDPENGGYCLCFDDRYLPAIEQFIYARYQMYRNVYHDSQKQLFEQIFEQLFRQAFSLLDAVIPDPTFELLKRIHEQEKFDTSSYLCLDDEAVNTLIKKWADGCILSAKDAPERQKVRAAMVQLLSKAFLYRSQLFEPVELGGGPRQYDLLAKRVGKLLGKDCGTFGELDSCAFIYIQGSDCAYESSDELPAARKNIILRHMDDGTACDYAQRSLFRAAHGAQQDSVLKTDYCYLFFSKQLLKEDCQMNGQPDEVVESVKQAVESAKPRRHIEIEKKFYCTQAQLQQAEAYLDSRYQNAAKTKKAQTDTYFDCLLDGRRLALFEKHFSFRRREKDGSYIFTVKIPTDSPNYRSPAQFARQEHELTAQKPDITDEVWQFLLDTLDICDKGGLRRNLSKDRLTAQLVVRNQRITYRLEDYCEICLDTVDYQNAGGDSVGPQNYQIEIELLGEPEAWAGLESAVIMPLVQTLGEDSLDVTSQSKLEKGMAFLMDQGT